MNVHKRETKHRHGPEGAVLSSIETVLPQCRWVSFHPESILPAMEKWGHLLGTQASWQHPCHFSDLTAETVRWVFVLDVLNHCFWPDVGKPTWTVEYQGDFYSGYWGLAASLKKAMEAGIPLTDAAFLSEISSVDLHRIFSGVGDIPLFEPRLNNLREAGKVLLEQWSGDILNLITAAGGSAIRTVHLVISSFPSFRDEAVYQEQRVYFWKRAQIFVSDLHAAFKGKLWGEFHDMEELTAFADYKLPQVLRELGVISYYPHLAHHIDSYQELAPGSGEEVEIRAVTVWAAEGFRKAYLDRGTTLTSTAVDNWLWQLGQCEPFRRRPYHRCRTIYY